VLVAVEMALATLVMLAREFQTPAVVVEDLVVMLAAT
jgi:hypothetical protein